MSGGSVLESPGLHEIAFLAPSTVRISFRGDVSAAEAEQISQFLERHTNDLERASFVVDLQRLGSLPPEARRALVSRAPRATGPAHIYRLAFVGANLRTKVLVSLVVAAADITSRDSLTSRFFGDLDSALSWARYDTQLGAKLPSGSWVARWR